MLKWFRVRGFGAGMVWGSRFWCWNGLGFEVLVLEWFGVQGFGLEWFGVQGFGAGVQGLVLGFRVWYWDSGSGC